jgi:membrane associated rhomboid family serine protease
MNFSLTIILIIVTVITTFYAWNNPDKQQRWLLRPYSVTQRKEYFRFITSGFIHNDGFHLFFNMFTLYFFGEAIEYIFGRLHGPIYGQGLFLLLYLAGIIISDLPTYFKHKNSPHYASLGASGGVSAVVFGSIMFFPTQNICIWGIICLPGFILGLLYLIYSYYQGKKSADNINHDAHMYGALFGIAFAIAVHPPVITSFIQQILKYSPF